MRARSRFWALVGGSMFAIAAWQLVLAAGRGWALTLFYGAFALVGASLVFSSLRRRRGDRERPVIHDEDTYEACLQLDLAQRTAGGKAAFVIERGHGAERIDVRWPPGVEPGQSLRLPTQMGSIILSLRDPDESDEDPHRLWLDPIEAWNGVTRTVEVAEGDPSGTLNVQVPPRTRHGTRLRLRGTAPPPDDGPASDLELEVLVALRPR